MAERWLILGAGSQAKVVADCLQALGEDLIGFVELGMNPEMVGGKLLRLPIIGVLNELPELIKQHGATNAHAAIGDNLKRRELLDLAIKHKLAIPSIEHPTSYVSPHAKIADGSYIAAQAMVGPLARIGEGCIVNTSASVDHDCELGQCVHIAVGTHLAGTVHVGDFTTIGAGCAAIPGVRIGERATVGAGATVVSDLPDGCTAVGTPAKPKG